MHFNRTISLRIAWIILLLVITSVNTSQVRAGPKEDAQAIVRLIITEATFAAIYTLKKDEIARKLKGFYDLSGVAEGDLDALLDLFLDESAKAMVAGMRKALAKKLVDEMPANDIRQLLTCHRGAKCTASDFSTRALVVLEELPRFGKEQGERIGFAIGNALTPKLLAIMEANTEGKFKDPEALIRALKTPRQ